MRVDDGNVVKVTLNRPDSMNAITSTVAQELGDALAAVDPTDCDAVVISGEGTAFSAGGDIEAMAAREETAHEAYERVRSSLGYAAEQILTAPAPVIAKVNGDAVGAGVSLVAAADFAYAADSARFGVSFVNVGLIPDLGATALLPRLIGLRATKRLAFTGQLFPATDAAEMNLVNKVVPKAELDDHISSLLQTLRDQPTETIGLAKRAIHNNIGESLEEGLEREAHVQALAYDTDAHREGVAAFLNRDE